MVNCLFNFIYKYCSNFFLIIFLVLLFFLFCFHFFYLCFYRLNLILIYNRSRKWHPVKKNIIKSKRKLFGFFRSYFKRIILICAKYEKNKLDFCKLGIKINLNVHPYLHFYSCKNLSVIV